MSTFDDRMGDIAGIRIERGDGWGDAKGEEVQASDALRDSDAGEHPDDEDQDDDEEP